MIRNGQFSYFFNSVQFCLSMSITAYRTKVHFYVHFRSVNISATRNDIAKKFQIWYPCTPGIISADLQVHSDEIYFFVTKGLIKYVKSCVINEMSQIRFVNVNSKNIYTVPKASCCIETLLINYLKSLCVFL